MYTGKLIFSQVMAHLPMQTFRRCVRRYDGHHKIKSFTCLDQFLCMAFAQLTYRESLRDIEACLRAQRDKLYHMGIRGGISRNTLANANKVRDWRIYADFAQALIRIARPLYAEEDLGLDLDNTVYALDASTIDLCLSVFPWALFRSTKSAVKLHTLLDLRGPIPAFIHLSDGKLHDVNVLDILVPEAGAFFVIRAKSNTQYQRRYSNPVDNSGGVRCDQTIVLTGVTSARDYPQPLRRIKSFFGTSENAVKSQIWIAISVYVLVAIIRKRLDIDANLYTILQVLSLTLFERTSLIQIVTKYDYTLEDGSMVNQLNLFD